MPVSSNIEPTPETCKISLGVGLPELILPGLLKALKQRPTECAVAVSLTRTAAAERIINAPPGQFSLALGCSGGSIKDTFAQVARAARQNMVKIKLEADHVLVWSSSVSHAQRTFGQFGEAPLDRRELAQSIAYINDVIEEAASVGKVSSFSIDAIDLIHDRAAQLNRSALRATFEQTGTPTQRRAFFQRYAEKPFRLNSAKKGAKAYKFTKDEVRVLALKYWDALQRLRQLAERVRQCMAGQQFNLELSLAETANPTTEKDLLFLLNELQRMDLSFTHVAPNLGFKPYRKYSGKLTELRNRLELLGAIAQSFGAQLALQVRAAVAHPTTATAAASLDYTGKFLKAVLDGTKGQFKFKLTDAYHELVLGVLSRMPRRSAGYNTYSRIFDNVQRFLRLQQDSGSDLVNVELARLLKQYDRDMRELKCQPRDLGAEFFRHYSTIATNLRDMRGGRYLRLGLLELYAQDKNAREKINTAVERFTLNVFDQLKIPQLKEK